jgi:hypothetical protein
VYSGDNLVGSEVASTKMTISAWLGFPTCRFLRQIGPGVASLAMKILYTVKKVSDISVSSRDVTYQTLPGRE